MVSKMPKQIEWVKLAKYSIPAISTNQTLEKPKHRTFVSSHRAIRGHTQTTLPRELTLSATWYHCLNPGLSQGFS